VFVEANLGPAGESLRGLFTPFSAKMIASGRELWSLVTIRSAQALARPSATTRLNALASRAHLRCSCRPAALHDPPAHPPSPVSAERTAKRDHRRRTSRVSISAATFEAIAAALPLGFRRL
jgi:hypothetical protein